MIPPLPLDEDEDETGYLDPILEAACSTRFEEKEAAAAAPLLV
jgi:hypothetical protein